ncbi:hypothetical protein ACFOTA_06710 [Chitinophaga sp. GCM10012297]|uniref:Uncharacterized protein n=1 Tax=Chitinophaga chungangae TaxID=2821488 RepID=A0ABS3YB55_9BACT|nr:hypothetical protein [Chitinophaga chungangae]MBO9151891.1 hypothetical protein [Chitinophaga chungangae]
MNLQEQPASLWETILQRYKPRKRPILFSGAMVRAIFALLKTQTRRIAKGVQLKDDEYPSFYVNEKGELWMVPLWKSNNLPSGSKAIKCPFGPGDILWVKETFQWVDAGEDSGYVYRATDPDWETTEEWRWKPSLFMPEKASRISLRVVSVRLERLQDISAEDAKAEGFACITKDGGLTWKYGIPDDDGLPGNGRGIGWPWNEWEEDPRNAFRTIWEKINGPGNWEASPWVWKIEFEKI